MTLAILQIGYGVCAMLVRGRSPMLSAPDLTRLAPRRFPTVVVVATLFLVIGHLVADLPLRPLHVHDRRRPGGGGSGVT